MDSVEAPPDPKVGPSSLPTSDPSQPLALLTQKNHIFVFVVWDEFLSGWVLMFQNDELDVLKHVSTHIGSSSSFEVKQTTHKFSSFWTLKICGFKISIGETYCEMDWEWFSKCLTCPKRSKLPFIHLLFINSTYFFETHTFFKKKSKKVIFHVLGLLTRNSSGWIPIIRNIPTIRKLWTFFFRSIRPDSHLMV